MAVEMTRLLLIRHGVNDLQEKGVLVGWTPGVHLSAEGRAQAKALAKRLAPMEIAAVYASPLERTVETAEIVAEPHGLKVTTREGLGEVRYGRWTGESLERLRRRRSWRTVQFVPSRMRFPGGESLREVQARVVEELERLRSDHAKQAVAIVSHADVIKAAVAFYAGLPLDMFQRLMVFPASLTALVLDGPMPMLACLNDTGHLPLLHGAGGEKK